MVKTITIADDVYEELVRMKGNKSFSELLRELIKKRKGNLEALFGIANSVDVKKLEKTIKEIEEAFEKWGESLIQA